MVVDNHRPVLGDFWFITATTTYPFNSNQLIVFFNMAIDVLEKYITFSAKSTKNINLKISKDSLTTDTSSTTSRS